MKKLLLIASLCALANADCGIKIAKLEQKLQIAKSYGNVGQIRGLEQALANVRAHCAGGYGAGYGGGYYVPQMPVSQGFYGDWQGSDLRARLDALEDEYERREDAIEDALDELSDRKRSMSKSEYNRQKRALKEQKRALKAEYKRQKRELKGAVRY